MDPGSPFIWNFAGEGGWAGMLFLVFRVPVALVFLANMCMFIKNAWFSENVRFCYFLDVLFRVVSFFFDFVFMRVVCCAAGHSWSPSIS